MLVEKELFDDFDVVVFVVVVVVVVVDVDVVGLVGDIVEVGGFFSSTLYSASSLSPSRVVNVET